MPMPSLARHLATFSARPATRSVGDPASAPSPRRATVVPSCGRVLPAACALALLTALASVPTLAAEARPDGAPLAIEPTLLGYNIGTWRAGPDWDDPAFRKSVVALAPGNLRYPGGTLANYFDWRSGTVIETIREGKYRYDRTRPRLTPATLVRNLPAGTAVVYVVNLARPTPSTGVPLDAREPLLRAGETLDAKIDDMLDAFEAFRRAGHRLRYVEIGNEFYQGAKGGEPGQGDVYSGDIDLYTAHANRVAEAVRGYDPRIEIAVLAEASRAAGSVSAWNRKLYAAIRGGRIADIDAVTLHWYSGPGDIGALEGADAAEKSLAQAHRMVEAVTERDLDGVPPGLDVWITEYNTFTFPTRNGAGEIDNGPIGGSWTNALFGAIQTLRFAALDERVELMDIHWLSRSGLTQWDMLAAPGRLSGNGVAMGALGKAFRGRTELRTLSFDGLPAAFDGGDTPSVYGVRLAGGGGEAIAVVNATRRAVGSLDVDAALLRGGRYRLEQHHDATPLSRPVRAGRGGGLVSRVRDYRGGPIALPPFSLTVIRALDD